MVAQTADSYATGNGNIGPSANSMGKKSLQILAGDDAPTANLAVSELSGAHLVVEEVTREPCNRRGLVN